MNTRLSSNDFRTYAHGATARNGVPTASWNAAATPMASAAVRAPPDLSRSRSSGGAISSTFILTDTAALNTSSPSRHRDPISARTARCASSVATPSLKSRSLYLPGTSSPSRPFVTKSFSSTY